MLIVVVRLQVVRAWSGNSEGFVTTVVELGRHLFQHVAGIAPGDTFVLGSAVNVHPLGVFPDVRFRWRMASDTSGSSEGWRVDTVNVMGCQGDPSLCSPTPTPPITPTPTVSPTVTHAQRPRQPQLHLQLLRRLHQRPLRGDVRHRGRGRLRRRVPKATVINYRCGTKAPTSSRELAWRFWGAVAAATWFGVAPKRTFLALRDWLDRVGERSPRWRGRQRQHARRVCYPDNIDTAARFLVKTAS